MLVAQKEVLTLLAKYGIRTPGTHILNGIPAGLRYPVVLKIDSPSIVHKTEIGAVILGIDSDKRLHEEIAKGKQAFAKYEPLTFIAQEQVKGVEIILGMKRDPTFGPVILYGLGGIFVELIKEVSIRVAPLNKKLCLSMVQELDASRILTGYRGSEPVNVNALILLMQKLSRLSMAEEDIQEIDFNPVFVNKKGVCVADARMIRNA